MTHCWQGINNKRQDSAMQCGKKKVPCGGSSALCEGARASPRPPGPHAQPLWAPLLLPVWWETPDPRGCAGACDTEPGGSGAGDTGRVRRGIARSRPRCKVQGGRWLERPGGTKRCWIRSPPITTGTGRAAGGGEGKEGASLSPALHPAGRPDHRTCC